MEQRGEEWQQLERRALVILERPHEQLIGEIPAKYTAVLRVWHFPSFLEHKAWVIYSSTTEKFESYLMQEINWDRPGDVERMTNPLVGLRHASGFAPNPCIATRIAAIQTEQIISRLNAMANLTVQPFSLDRHLCLDGEITGVEMLKSANISRFSWSGDGPAGWSGLCEWTMNSIEYFRESLIGIEAMTVDTDDFKSFSSDLIISPKTT